MWSVFLISGICGLVGFWLTSSFIGQNEDRLPKPEFCSRFVGLFIGLCVSFIPIAYIWHSFWIAPVLLLTLLFFVLIIMSILFLFRYKTLFFNISRLKEKRNLQGLVGALLYGSWSIRGEAATALGEVGDESVVEPLIKALLKKQQLSVRHEAAKALGAIKSEKSIDALIESLQYVPGAASEALGEIGSPLAIDALSNLFLKLGLSNWESLSKASDALVKIGDSSTRTLTDMLSKVLTGQLKLADYTSAQYLIRTLGKIRNIEPVPVLVDALKQNFMSMDVVEALCNIGDDRAIVPLISHLDRDDAFIIQGVGLGLAKLGKIAIDKFVDALHNDTGKKFWSIGRALTYVGYKPNRIEDSVDFYLATENWSQLVKIGEASLTPRIFSFLKDKELELPANAFGIGKYGASTYYDVRKKIRTSIAKMLGEIRSPKAIEHLYTILCDYYDTEYIRVACANALGKIGQPAINKLINFLNTQKPSDYANRVAPSVAGGINWAPLSSFGSLLSVKEEVLRAMGVIGDEVAIEAICTYLSWLEGIAKTSEDSDNFNFIGYSWSVNEALDSLENIFEKSHCTKNIQTNLTYWINYRNKEEKDYIVSIRNSARRLYNLLGY